MDYNVEQRDVINNQNEITIVENDAYIIREKNDLFENNDEGIIDYLFKY
jgi:hypothetical protein